MKTTLEPTKRLVVIKPDKGLEVACDLTCTCDQHNMVTHDAMCRYCWQQRNFRDKTN